VRVVPESPQPMIGTCRVLRRTEVPKATLAHHQDGKRLWVSHGRRIVCIEDGVRQLLGTLPFVLPRDLFGFPRLAQRAMRADKCNVLPTGPGKLLAVRANRVYAVIDGSVKHLFDIQGDCVLNGGIGVDNEGWAYLGEYFMNARRGPVRIWRVSPDLNRHEVAYEFPAGQVRHVHGVFRDPFDSEALWVPTGDFGKECFLVRTRDRFNSLEWFGDGSQTWRAVHLFFTPEHVCWITDSNIEPNFACRMHRSTGQLQRGSSIANPGWYGLTTEDGLHFACTTVEKGPGVTSEFAEIMVSEDAFEWRVVDRFKKDWYKPLRLFKFGVISCPSGRITSDNVCLSGEGLVGFDGCLKRFHFERGATP